MNSSFGEIKKQWKLHIEFNGWEFKKINETTGVNYKRMNIDEIPFL